jgi:DNA-binding GntR family transcriptional regulator
MSETAVGQARQGAAPARTRFIASLRHAIGEGLLKPGSRLSERELCESYEVSRTVVREGLRQLEGEGLVTIESNSGASVANISYTDAEHLFEVRGALESLACSLFARRGTVEQKRVLAASVAQTADAMRNGAIADILEAKDTFYDALLAGAGNAELTSALRLLHTRIRLLRRYSLSAEDRHLRSLAEITAISDAIIGGDVEGARRAGEYHVAQAGRAALPRIFNDAYSDSV